MLNSDDLWSMRWASDDGAVGHIRAHLLFMRVNMQALFRPVLSRHICCWALLHVALADIPWGAHQNKWKPFLFVSFWRFAFTNTVVHVNKVQWCEQTCRQVAKVFSFRLYVQFVDQIHVENSIHKHQKGILYIYFYHDNSRKSLGW